MGNIVFFLIIIFVIVPIIKNAAGGSSKSKPKGRTKSASNAGQKNWSQVQELLREQMRAQNKNNNFGKKNKHGHSDDRARTHQRLHKRDGNKQVFPESHQARVKKRDQRDRSERNRIEAMMHSKNNRAIVREDNKGLDGWGARGDRSGGGGFLFLLLFGLGAFLVLTKVAPDLWSEIMRTFNN